MYELPILNLSFPNINKKYIHPLPFSNPCIGGLVNNVTRNYIQYLNISQNYKRIIKMYFYEFKDWCSADKKCGTLHDFACHPCAGAMLIFSVSFQF